MDGVDRVDSCIHGQVGAERHKAPIGEKRRKAER